MLWLTLLFIQGDSGVKVKTLRGDSTGHYKKKNYMNTRIIFNICRVRAVESPFDFYLCGGMKREVYRRKLDTSDELIARILDAVTGIKKSEEQNTFFAHELRSVLKLTVGFTYIYC